MIDSLSPSLSRSCQIFENERRDHETEKKKKKEKKKKTGLQTIPRRRPLRAVSSPTPQPADGNGSPEASCVERTGRDGVVSEGGVKTRFGDDDVGVEKGEIERQDEKRERAVEKKTSVAQEPLRRFSRHSSLRERPLMVKASPP